MLSRSLEFWPVISLKLNIQKTNKILASGPITLWQLEGEKVEAVTDFACPLEGML